MIQLTAEAQHMLDEYLRKAKLCLSETRAAEAEEVARDLREHAERELQDAPQPVAAAEMAAVLERLGRPEQLVPEEELSWWQQLARRWRTGPHDWRLAYISLGVLVIGTPWLGPVAVLAAFLVARAALETVPDARELGPQRWFLYPSLLLVYVPLAILLLFWPVGWLIAAIAKAALTALLPQFRGFGSPNGAGLSLSHLPVLLSVPLLFVWWLVLAHIVRRSPTFLPTLFRPFVRTSGTSLVGRIMLYGLLLLCLLFAARLLVAVLVS